MLLFYYQHLIDRLIAERNNNNMIIAEDLDKLKSLPIRQVAERLGIEVSEHGNARCFKSENHKNGDRNKSLGFNDLENYFSCFTCRMGGSTIDLVASYYNIDISSKDGFQEACNRLAQLMGVSIRNEKMSKSFVRKGQTISSYIKPKTQKKVRIDSDGKYHVRDTKVYTTLWELAEQPNAALLSWWHSRGLDDSLLAEAGWRIITQKTWDEFTKRYDDATLISEGLKSDDNGRIRDIFWRGYNVMVPFFDSNHQVMCFKLRTLDPKVKEKYNAKYFSPRLFGRAIPIYAYETLIKWKNEILCEEKKQYHQQGSDSKTLFDTAKLPPLYISESETDSLAVRQYGKLLGEKYYCVAIPGGNKSPDSLIVRELMQFIRDTIYVNLDIPDFNIVTDTDEVGEHFYNTLKQSLEKIGVTKKHIHKFQPYIDTEFHDMGEFVASA